MNKASIWWFYQFCCYSGGYYQLTDTNFSNDDKPIMCSSLKWGMGEIPNSMKLINMFYRKINKRDVNKIHKILDKVVFKNDIEAKMWSVFYIILRIFTKSDNITIQKLF